MTAPLAEAYETMLAKLGPQGWWPGDSPLEIMVGALLVQNTAWTNAAKAIANLKDAGLLVLERLATRPCEDLEAAIRPAGHFRQKAARLQRLARFVVKEYGALAQMFAAPTKKLRTQLLALNGIGPETADAILLYAAGRPTFVVDAYTTRVLARHGWIEFGADYHSVQQVCTDNLPRDAALYNEMHALLVEVGKRHCKKEPLCEGCPLQPLLPPGGARAPEEYEAF